MYPLMFSWVRRSVVVVSSVLFGALIFSPLGYVYAAESITRSAPAVFSSTHPDETRWYSSNDPEFSWTLPPDVEAVSYLLNENPLSNPGNLSDGLKSSVLFKDISEGTRYFHIKFRRQGTWGLTRHFSFNVDTLAPEAFEVIPVGGEETTRARIMFVAEDAVSGIARYEVVVDEGTPRVVAGESAGMPLLLSEITPGEHSVAVTAIDHAGNRTSAGTNITVSAIERPIILEATSRALSGESISVSGIGPAKNRVIAYAELSSSASDQQSIAQVVSTVSDGTGHWRLTFSALSDGTYRIYAFTEYDDGAFSLPSEAMRVQIGGLGIGWVIYGAELVIRRIAEWQQRWFGASIVLYTLLALAFAYFVLPRMDRAGHSFWQFQQKVRALRRLSHNEQAMTEQLGALQRDLLKELELLQEVSRHRSLYPDERYLRTKLLQYQKTLKPLARGSVGAKKSHAQRTRVRRTRVVA